jgi:hypothetical protein
VAAVGLFDALLERVPGAVRVYVSRLRLVEEIAQVEEVLLVGTPLRKIGLPRTCPVLPRI